MPSLQAQFLAICTVFVVACGDEPQATTDLATVAGSNGNESATPSREDGPNVEPQKLGCLADAARCTLETVASDLHDPRAIAFDAGTLWVQTSKGLVRMKGTERRTFTRVTNSINLAVIGDTVAWENMYSIQAMNPSVSEETRTLADRDDDGLAPSLLQTSNGSLYFKRGSSSLYALEPGQQWAKFVGNLWSTTTSFAIDSKARVRADGDRTKSEITIVYHEDGAAEAKDLVTLKNASWVTGMVLSPTHTLFAVREDATIRAVPRTGGEARIVAEHQGDVFGLVADPTGVYWVSREGLRWAALDGSASRLLARIEWKSFVGKVALAPDALYVSNPGNGSVSKLLK